MLMLSDSRLVPKDEAELSRPAHRDAFDTTDLVWHEEVQVRAAQVQKALETARWAAAFQMFVAAGLWAFFWRSPDWVDAACLLLVATVGALAMYTASLVDFRCKPSPLRLRVGLTVVMAFAAVTGLAWGTLPVALFLGSDADQRLVVLAAVVVVMANVYRLGPLQMVALVHIVPLCVGSAVGFCFGGPAASALAVFVPIYGGLLLNHCARLNAAASRQIVDRLSVVAQNDTIHELLLDFDDNTSDWLWRTDATNRLVGVSKSDPLALPSTIQGSAFELVFAQGSGAAPAGTGGQAIAAALAARKPFRNLLVGTGRDAASRWWRLSGKPLHDAAGQFLGYRGVGSDMTGARNFESRIAQLANYDALTGFANRANFQTFVRHQCAAVAIDGLCRALLSLDLDGFKSVNDSLGHEGGDELLRQVAVRLTASAPAGTFIARLGGDEFALWLHPTTPARAQAAADALIEVLGIPFDIHGLQIDIGASVGIALTPKHTVEPEDLLVKADLALYRAKLESKGKACIFVPSFATSLMERRKLEGDLKLALARGEFGLYYQPLFDLSLGRIVGFEALIRWQSPDRGFVSPADFIPAAESMGLISAIGRWVLFEACRAAATWPPDVRVAVNVSPPHVRSPEFQQDVVMALKMSGLHPSRLEIEVTEGVFLDKSVAALDALRTLRKRGIRIALDDFGTGYSSLNYLIDFPVDKIKIDQSFVRDLIDSHANQAIIDAMLGLARKLSIRVTAEGVETKEQALALKRRRCDEIQGYLLSRPRPGSDVPEMIALVPALFRAAVPTYTDSPLSMVPSAKKQAG